MTVVLNEVVEPSVKPAVTWRVYEFPTVAEPAPAPLAKPVIVPPGGMGPPGPGSAGQLRKASPPPVPVHTFVCWGVLRIRVNVEIGLLPEFCTSTAQIPAWNPTVRLSDTMVTGGPPLPVLAAPDCVVLGGA